MNIYTEIIGNIYQDQTWSEKIKNADIEKIYLDQWTAQKSRFLAKGDKGNEYPIALKRHSQVINGDIIYYSPEENKAVILQIDLSPVMVIDMSELTTKDPETMIRRSVELGHAIGNQHWPAVVKGTQVYVPLTVDKKVMLSVMETHHLEGITFEFHQGLEIIPYLAPHEIRRLFGGAGQESHSHEHSHEHGNQPHSHNGHTHTH